MNDVKPAVILLVDDDPDDLAILTEAFQQVDNTHEIVEAYDGKAALLLLDEMKSREELPFLVVLDINMPILDGRQVLKLMKENKDLKDIPVVVLSTSSSFFDKQYCDQYGVELITKPSTMGSLVEIARRILSICNA